MPYPTSEPNRNLLANSLILGREEPKKQLVRVVGILTDGETSRVRFAHVKVNVGQSTAVNDEL